jgi:GT2 family glycosyltransferase
MTQTPSLSVVVASHGRPGTLRRCLTALSQSAFARLEVIVVADKEGLEVAARLPFGDRLKTVLQADPNLSKARNDGIVHAVGDIVAFVDDDAVPEPTWAGALVAAFAASSGTAAVTGPVLGRNGISLQWGRVAVDRQGRDIEAGDPDEPLPDGTVLKLHGTNMALRRSVLLVLGGFDPAFRYYLEDTDLSLRLAAAGHKARWLPDAQVHHEFAASTRRTTDRVPLSLFDIGASTAVFLRKHAPSEIDDALRRLTEDQRARLFRFVRKRKLGARDLEALMISLRDGITDGRARAHSGNEIAARHDDFLTLTDTPVDADVVLCGRRLHSRRIRAEAERLTKAGTRVTVFLFEPTPRAHRVRYTDGGWWEQRGGIYGRSDRKSPRFQVWSAKMRLSEELRRIAATRFANDPRVEFRNR